MAVKEGFIRLVRDTPVVSVLTVGSLVVLLLYWLDVLSAIGLGFIEPAEGESGSLWLALIGLTFVFGLSSYIVVGLEAVYTRIYRSRPLRVKRFARVSKMLAELPPEQRGIIAAAVQNWSPRIEVERSALRHAVRLEHQGVLRDLSTASEDVTASRRYVIKRAVWEALLTDPDLLSEEDAKPYVTEEKPLEPSDAGAQAGSSDQAGSPMPKSGGISVRMAETAMLDKSTQPSPAAQADDGMAPKLQPSTPAPSGEPASPAAPKPKLPPLRTTLGGTSPSSSVRGRAFPNTPKPAERGE